MDIRLACFVTVLLAVTLVAGHGRVLAATGVEQPLIELESPGLHVVVNSQSGVASVRDAVAGEVYGIGDGDVLGRFIFRQGQDQEAVLIGSPRGSRVGFESWQLHTQDDVTTLTLVLKHETSKGPLGLSVSYRLDGSTDQLSIEVETHPESAMPLETATIHFPSVRWQHPDEGYIVVPQRQGALVPAGDVLAPTVISMYHQRGLSMPFFGVVDGPAAWMVMFDTIEAEVRISNSPRGGNIQLTLAAAPYSLELRALPNGNYVNMAQIYRQRAIQDGLFVSLKEKILKNPDVARIVGALDVKFFFEGGRFDEPVQGLRKLKDMGADNLFVIYAGWMMRGYDFLHPDVVSYDVTLEDGMWRDAFGHPINEEAVTVNDDGITGRVVLPAQPHAGGDQGLQEAANAIRELGFLFGLHDNYQDIYGDAPSFHPSVTLRDERGEPRKGGVWAGGQAYLLHPAHGLKFAQRNIPELLKMLPLDVYFVDTTTATPFYRDDHPESTLTRADDMRLRRELLEYLRSEIGVVGSEAGGAWAVPYTDYFEGMAGSEIGVSIPLFDLVFHDAVLRQRHQGDGDLPGQPEKILDALRSGRPSNFSIWNRVSDGLALSGRLLEGWPMTLPEYIRMAALITGTLNEITSFHPMQDHEFLTEDRLVERSRFMSDLGPVTVVVNRSEYHYTYGDHELPPCGLIIEAPSFVAAYVTRFEGVELARPTLFALKALDGKALRESGEILVYQGDPEDPTHVPLMGEMIVVGQERIIKR